MKKIIIPIGKSNLLNTFLKGNIKFICSLLFVFFTLSSLLGQACNEYAAHISSQVQGILSGTGTSNAIYDSYSTTDSCAWAASDWTGRVDFSGIAFDDNRAGTLISPRHILMATHYKRAIGSTLTFHDSQGHIHTATLIALGSVPGGTVPDITVGLLDVDVPVTYYRVLPPKENWEECLDGALTISTHHSRYASIREVSGTGGVWIYFSQSINVPSYYYSPVVSGNSGNPSFLIVNDEPILVSTFTYSSGTGPFFSTPDNYRAIDSLMTLLGGGYLLETNGIDEDGDGYYDFEDCDDTDIAINPAQVEIPFNGLDDDCDPSTLDHDEDMDGYSIDVDCNDQDPNINPGQVEIPNNDVDEDCDGVKDYDEDLDGYFLGVDCNDQDPDIHPGAEEILNNNIDDDCDGWIDELDADNDGFVFSEDCDDNNPYINPNAVEIPNNDIDENCDDELLQIEACETYATGPYTLFINSAENCEEPDAANFQVWTNEFYPVNNLEEGKVYFFDFCQGYDPEVWEAIITVMASNNNNDYEKGYVISAQVGCRIEFQFSYQEEFPDVMLIVSNRNDCTGPTDNTGNGIPQFGCLDGQQDQDDDGFIAIDDCDDNDPLVNPSATEIAYNGIDDDCNPLTPDNDLDQDGYHAYQDCDDNDPSINPSAAEIVYNGIDDDCDPLTLDDDLDQDGFVAAEDCDDNNPSINPSASEIVYNGIDDDCNPLTLDDDLDQDGFVTAEDCDDNNAEINPDINEDVYNGIDDDCNPLTLDDDLDQDGFLFVDDCDDENENINPDAVEIPNNGIDEDCDGMDTTTSTFELTDASINIYPNPASDYIIIDIDGILDYQLSVFDLTGTLLSKSVGSKQINLASIQNGIYLLEIIDLNSSEKVVRKIEVIR